MWPLFVGAGNTQRLRFVFVRCISGAALTRAVIGIWDFELAIGDIFGAKPEALRRAQTAIQQDRGNIAEQGRVGVLLPFLRKMEHASENLQPAVEARYLQTTATLAVRFLALWNVFGNRLGGLPE